ncbi:cation:dicarboxylate symporter family transporter [Clostridioides difficile]|uniref:cation:dicarboxylate symporter family transporter n=1 Tax=Clostridioides difficile TaxID=1496 RepID=UPI00038CA06D|nr:cation:dicarboxylase symporter family transporter [Clostridioides difficile]EQH49787.1 C4-dicarboxylate anaerobic carrier family protein [Clostridioides difficile DA00245]
MKKKIGLVPKLIIGIIVGILIGSYAPEIIVQILVTVSTLFSAFLKFVIPFIIIGFVTAGIADLATGAGKLLGITTGIAYGSTLIAGLLSFAVSTLIFPNFIDASVASQIGDPEAGMLAPIFTIPLEPMVDVTAAIVFAFVMGLGISAFAGVAGGFAANVMLSTTDVLLAGFTIPAAQMMDPSYQGNPAMNLYFAFISAIVLTFAGAFVTEKFIAPRFTKYNDSTNDKDIQELSELENKGIKYALLSLLVVVVVIVALCIGDNAFMKDPETGSILSSNAPLMKGIVPIITIIFLTPGLVYGKVSKKIKSDKDLVSMMGSSMSDMGGYIVLAFIASQFINLFNLSNLGTILSITGAKLLAESGIPSYGLIIGFILLSGFINLFVGSASAKWAILAPIFVPMFMLLDFNPALTQIAYRIGDASTNPISPLFPYFPVILAFARRYDKDIGIGTVISNMIPYSVVFTLIEIIILLLFMGIGIPLGPGGGISYVL